MRIRRYCEGLETPFANHRKSRRARTTTAPFPITTRHEYCNLRAPQDYTLVRHRWLLELTSSFTKMPPLQQVPLTGMVDYTSSADAVEAYASTITIRTRYTGSQMTTSEREKGDFRKEHSSDTRKARKPIVKGHQVVRVCQRPLPILHVQQTRYYMGPWTDDSIGVNRAYFDHGRPTNA